MSAPDESSRTRPRWLMFSAGVVLLLAVVIAGLLSGNHYLVRKRLEAKLTDMDRIEPGWRLAEIEAAREEVPENANSARVVVAAAELLPKDWLPDDLENRLIQVAPQERIAADDFARLKAALEKVKGAISEARKLADLPRGRHRVTYLRNPLNILLPGQQQTRKVSLLLVRDALRCGQEGDPAAAMISCRAALNAARSVGDEPFLISQLMRNAGVLIACRGVERVLGQGEAPAASLDEFRKLLEIEDAFAELTIGSRGERASFHELFDAIECGDVAIKDISDAHPSLGGYVFDFITRDDLRKEHPLLLSLMTQWIAITQLPLHEQADAEHQLEFQIQQLNRSTVLIEPLMMSLTKMGETSRRKHAQLRCMIAALAVERYRQTHKKWPDPLDKVCPQFLSAAPLDPFDGQPLRYRRLGDGVVIYSVGKDGIDDGGKLDPGHSTQPGVDLGYRLWDVAKRRQPASPKPPQGAKPE